jgi:hypothetical protein
MKTAFSLVALVVFSALMLAPKESPEYPVGLVLEQRREIVFKEQKINALIREIEYTLVIDSLTIKKPR